MINLTALPMNLFFFLHSLASPPCLYMPHSLPVYLLCDGKESYSPIFLPAFEMQTDSCTNAPRGLSLSMSMAFLTPWVLPSFNNWHRYLYLFHSPRRSLFSDLENRFELQCHWGTSMGLPKQVHASCNWLILTQKESSTAFTKINVLLAGSTFVS